jgi:hypothetical protein
MSMQGIEGWLPDQKTASIAHTVWWIVVILHGVWRSRGEARPDPIRESGPIL